MKVGCQGERGNAAGVNRYRSGYILLLVLVTLVVAGTSLVKVASQSLRHTSASLQAVDNLQAKWLRLASERIALDQAPDFFDQLEVAQPATERYVMRQTVVLGDCSVVLLISDESTRMFS